MHRWVECRGWAADPTRSESRLLTRGLGTIPYLVVQSLFDTPSTTPNFAMATDVLSPTRHRSNSIPQTTSNTKLRGSGVEPQTTSGPRPTPDEVVDRILLRAKSPLGEDEARKIVEALEKVSRDRLPPNDWCFQPENHRCWSPTAKSVCARGGDVSGDSWRFAGNTPFFPTRTSFPNPISRGWVIPPYTAVSLIFGRECMREENPSQSKPYSITSQTISRRSKE